MKKPYAASTLNRKYREIGIEPKGIQVILLYLTACSHFYKIIETEDAWKVIGKECEQFGAVNKADFDALLPIFQRDGHLPFYLEQESDFYVDGKEKLLLIDKDYLLVPEGEACSLVEDWERFYTLDQQRLEKELYIAEDIIRYVEPEYFEETPQVDALRRFFISKDVVQIPFGIQEKGKRDALRNEAVETALQEIHRIICDASVAPDSGLFLALKCVEEMGCQIEKEEQLNRFLELYTEMSNHTRMPSNRGCTPEEMVQQTGGIPQQMELGPGILNLVRQGEIDGNALKKMIMGEGNIPLEIRAGLLRQVN